MENIVGRTYEECGALVEALAAQVAQSFHQRLIKHGVTIGYLFARAPRDENDEPTGPAITGHGYPAAAMVRIVPLRDRANGLPDAQIILDGDEWPTWSEARRRAVIDHELEHLMPVGECDDLGRPKLKLAKHDFHLGGFLSVIRRHQEEAVELQALRDAGKAAGEVTEKTFWG